MSTCRKIIRLQWSNGVEYKKVQSFAIIFFMTYWYHSSRWDIWCGLLYLLLSVIMISSRLRVLFRSITMGNVKNTVKSIKLYRIPHEITKFRTVIFSWFEKIGEIKKNVLLFINKMIINKWKKEYKTPPILTWEYQMLKICGLVQKYSQQSTRWAAEEGWEVWHCAPGGWKKQNYCWIWMHTKKYVKNW